MLAPKYIEADHVLLRTRERELSRHKQRLKSIKKSITLKNCVSERKISHRPYNRIKKEKDIKQENKIMLIRLMGISYRKNLPPAATCKKSLNSVMRRKEAGRITAENKSMYKRLNSSRPSVSQKRLEVAYKHHNYLLRRMSKDKIIKTTLRRCVTPNSLSKTPYQP